MYSTVNTNPETGIRFGVISLHKLDPTVADDLFYSGENISEKAALEELRAEIAAAMRDEEEESGKVRDIDDFNDELDRRVERASEQLQIDEPYIEGESEGVVYGISWLGGAPLLWVYRSPYMTYRSLCSPCVPNALDLDSPFDPHGVLGYDIPPDWREG